jgi:hypothetical protein
MVTVKYRQLLLSSLASPVACSTGAQAFTTADQALQLYSRAAPHSHKGALPRLLLAASPIVAHTTLLQQRPLPHSSVRTRPRQHCSCAPRAHWQLLAPESRTWACPRGAARLRCADAGASRSRETSTSRAACALRSPSPAATGRGPRVRPHSLPPRMRRDRSTRARSLLLSPHLSVRTCRLRQAGQPSAEPNPCGSGTNDTILPQPIGDARRTPIRSGSESEWPGGSADGFRAVRVGPPDSRSSRSLGRVADADRASRRRISFPASIPCLRRTLVRVRLVRGGPSGGQLSYSRLPPLPAPITRLPAQHGPAQRGSAAGRPVPTCLSGPVCASSPLARCACGRAPGAPPNRRNRPRRVRPA